MYIMIGKHSRTAQTFVNTHDLISSTLYFRCLLGLLNVNEAVKAFQKICQMSLM
jgi:hypothetical protein